MFYKGIPEDRLKLIEPLAVEVYVEARGWQKVEEIDQEIAVFRRAEDETVELLVPQDQDFADYFWRMAEVVAVIAEHEDRPVLAILDELTEGAQRALRESLHLTCSTLRHKRVIPKRIQAIVTAIVKAWSQRAYHQDKPPPPRGVPPFPSDMLPCKLCNSKLKPTPEGCCPYCGLFCSDWLRGA